MRARNLSEIKMKPGYLQKISRNINCLIGIEFEMGIPYQSFESDDEDTNDYSYDKPIKRRGAIEDIVDFYNVREYNSIYTIRILESKLLADFEDSIAVSWEDAKENIIRKHIKDYDLDHYDENDIQRIIDNNSTRLHAELLSDFISEHESKFLNDLGMVYMSDIMDRYTVAWPYREAGSSKFSVETLANDFRQFTGYPVLYSDRYKGVKIKDDTYKNTPDLYILEIDRSIEQREYNDIPLELKSPPKPLNQIDDVITKVKRWAESHEAYTNTSTGLHLNISFPNVDLVGNLDYLKLIVLLNDSYVAQQFNRYMTTWGQEYCTSQLDQLLTQSKNLSEKDVRIVLNNFRDGIIKGAMDIIYYYKVSGHVAVNWKLHDNIIELRAPGGNYLESNVDDGFFEKIMPTVYRFVVATDAAINKSKYRNEYLKKLYQILSPTFIRYYDKIDPLNSKQPTALSALYYKPPSLSTKNLGRYVEPSEDDIIKIFIKYLTDKPVEASRDLLFLLRKKRYLINKISYPSHLNPPENNYD
jgi:hypothetical protein